MKKQLPFCFMRCKFLGNAAIDLPNTFSSTFELNEGLYKNNVILKSLMWQYKTICIDTCKFVTLTKKMTKTRLFLIYLFAIFEF